MRYAYIDINLDNLIHNYLEIKKITKNKKICAVIKANACGHGAVLFAKTLEEQNIAMFGVAMLEEAIELRKNGIQTPILIIGFTPPEDFGEVIKYNITQTIYSVEDFDFFANVCKELNIKGKIHLKIDCGMGRIGFSNSKDLKALFFELNENQNLMIEGIFMHPPMSDSGNLIKAQEQLQDFTNLVEEIKELNIPIIHATNSASIIELEKSHFNMVRTGAALYGYYSSDFVHKKLDLKPVLSLKAKLIHVKEVLKGTPIGYGGSYITLAKTKIGTIPIGFGDGYPKSLTNKTFVLIKGVRCQIVGKIAMDMMMVDLKDLDVNKNEEVVLIGEQGFDYLSAYEVANFARLYEFELMCNLSLRLKRNYYKNGGLIWNI